MQVVLMTLVGGLGTMLGPVVGAFVIVAMQNYLAEFGSWVTIIQGAVFVACVLAFRQGIVGGVLELLDRMRFKTKRERAGPLKHGRRSLITRNLDNARRRRMP